jgi:hypothetical protein
MREGRVDDDVVVKGGVGGCDGAFLVDAAVGAAGILSSITTERSRLDGEVIDTTIYRSSSSSSSSFFLYNGISQ